MASQIGGFFLLIGLLLTLPSLSAQRILDTVAGGAIRSGAPAQEVMIGSGISLARDPSGNIVFPDAQGTVIRRINRATGIIETIAGTGQPGMTGDGGPAKEARIGARVLTYDPAGNLYFADVLRIRKISADGLITTVAGTGLYSPDGPQGEGGPALQAQVGTVTALAFDSKGNLYYSEIQGFVHRLTTKGSVERIAGTGSNSISFVITSDEVAKESIVAQPMGLAVDHAGNVYVSQNYSLGSSAMIRKITPDGIIHVFNALFLDSLSNAPLAFDAEGNLYSFAGSAVLKYNAGSTTPVRIAGASVPGASREDGPALSVALSSGSIINGGPTGLAVAPNGDVFIRTGGQIRTITGGQVVTVAGASPQSAPDFSIAKETWLGLPTALAVTPDGTIYFSEYYGCRIRKIDAQGRIVTVAGTGRCGTAKDGPALLADMPHVDALAVDSRGRVYYPGVGGLAYISPEGQIVGISKTDSQGAIGAPRVLVDSKDKVYFVFFGLGTSFYSTLHEVTPDGIVTTQFRAQDQTKRVDSIALDFQDRLYMCVAIPRGPSQCTFGPALPAEDAPVAQVGSELAFEPSGKLWTTRFNTLWRADLPFSGTPSGPSADGVPFSSTYISNPKQLTITRNNDIYFFDQTTFRIRRVSASAPIPRPVISSGGVVNGASLVGGTLSSGELISIFGTNLATPGIAIATPENNQFPSTVAGVGVYFSGNMGRIVFASPTQINVFVPTALYESRSLDVVVNNNGVLSEPVNLPMARSAFGLVSVDSSGSGQGAILNQDYLVNSANNAAPRGSIVTLFGTGEGSVKPTVPTGGLVLSSPLPTVEDPVTVTIDGRNAEVMYAGSAPTLAVGVFQINVRIPPDVTPGNAPIVVTIGALSTVKTVTVAVK